MFESTQSIGCEEFEPDAQVPISMSPDNIQVVDGFQRWKDFVRENFPWLEHKNHVTGQFEARVSSCEVGSGSLSTIQVSASEVVRTRHLAEASEAGFLKLMWQISGALSVEQDGRENVVSEGEATVLDTARPYRIVISDAAKFAVLTLPYETCAGWEHISQKLCGTKLNECPATRAALGALIGVSSVPYDPADSANGTVIQAVQLMLSSALHRAASKQGVIAFEDQRLSCAQKYVAANIGDTSLDANDLASALCMSRRSLYSLFKRHGTTPTKMITNLRLDRCRQVLGDGTQIRRKITDIAFDMGFGNYATFSRLFKSKFGATPSEYRQQLN